MKGSKEGRILTDCLLKLGEDTEGMIYTPGTAVGSTAIFTILKLVTFTTQIIMRRRVQTDAGTMAEIVDDT